MSDSPLKRRQPWWLVLVVVAAAATLVACQKPSSNKPGSQAAAAAAGAASAATPMLELAAGDVAQAQMAELGAVLKVSGSLKAVSSAMVKAKVAAELKSLAVREGEQVQAGQLLGVQDTTEFDWRLRQAEEQAAAAQAQLDIARRTLDNNKALVDQGFISRNALDTSSSNVSGAEASLQAARAAAEIARKAVRDTRLVAPIKGLVAQRFVQAGERVGVDARVVEIVDLDRLELEAPVPPDEVVKLRVGQAALVQVDGLAQPVAAKVARINPSAQTGSRTVLAYLALDATPTLRQGLFASANVELQRKQALVVPASALRTDQAQPYALVLKQGVVQQTRVTTGLRGQVGEEAVIEVTSGLNAGDPVLRASVGALRSGTRVKLEATAATGTPAAASSPKR